MGVIVTLLTAGYQTRRHILVAASEAGAMNGIFLIPVTGGERRTLLSGGLSEEMFVFPSVSPRGDSLAYALCRGIFCDAYALSLGDGAVSQGPPRRLTTARVNLFGIAWTSDGQSIVYSSVAGGGQALWRTAIADGRTERLPLTGTFPSSFPTVASRSGALAYVTGGMLSVWKIEAGAPPKTVSSGYDAYLSPDGKRIAFVSIRPDGSALRAASADGTNPTRLTSPIPGKQPGSPRWSPDGRQIAFDAQSDDVMGCTMSF
jgi:Tol biopolymer transport system component